MKRLSEIFMILAMISTVFVTSCGKKKAGNESAKIGDSCEGIGAMSARMACQDDKIIFCSSYTKYKYKLQNDCGSKNLKCKLASNGKSASCVK